MSELDPNVNGEVPQVKEYTAVEQQALEQGWIPKESFDGDEDSFIDAKEFVRRGELFSKIDTQKREIKAVKEALNAFKQHYTKVEQAAYDKALIELKSAQKQALSDGDVDKFYEIGDEITEAERQAQSVQAAKQALDIAEQPTQVAPEFQAWVNRNPWYENYEYMRDFADKLGPKLHSRGLEPKEVLKQVEIAVRKEFPNKFTNPNKEKPGMTESGISRVSSSSQSNDFELNEQEKKICDTLVRSGVITKEKYIADLKKVKNIK